ncbi:CaiB/BaiF CoA-transferase family protein [Marinovum sp.]|uniref:CaiB/BaiF CoA transferase family protein n=1 Tax=Marinovum sp. TaxID=2024839 RepID=UPI002B27BCBB|nr:CaiB/BaiF CoA-transferase family protein [Marinovum sp.]
MTVIEMAGIGPCPLAGQMLADHGATVILVTRDQAEPDPADVTRRGKHLITLDLKSPAGHDALLRLVESADVLIEGYRPGVMERLGLAPEECHARNPRLIYGRMTGWGQTGPRADQPGHDLNYLSLTGALAAMGPADRPPFPPLNLVADYGGGTMFLLFGVVMALLERTTSGKGQVIDAAMMDGVMSLLSLFHGWQAQGRMSDARQANLLDGGAPFYRCYETKDRKFVALAAIEPKFYAALLRVLDLPETWLTQQFVRSTWPDRAAVLQRLFRERDRDDWMALFDGTEACVTPVLDWTEVANDPHVRARKSMVERGGVKQARPAPRLSRTPAAVPTTLSAAGANTAAVLRGMGFNDREIAAMDL